jgi:hypothetical protein
MRSREGIIPMQSVQEVIEVLKDYSGEFHPKYTAIFYSRSNFFSSFAFRVKTASRVKTE